MVNNSLVNWKNKYCNNYYYTLETKFSSFQLKLNLRAVVTKVHLHGFGISDSNLCSFCNLNPETTIH